MRYCIDILRIIDNTLRVEGWALNTDNIHQVEIEVKSREKNVEAKVVRLKRNDVANLYLKDDDKINIGFSVVFDFVEGENYYLYIRDSKKTVKEKLNRKIVDDFNSFSKKRYKKIMDYLTIKRFFNAFDMLREKGIKEVIRKTKSVFKGLNVDYDYDEWYRITKPTDRELKRQRDNYKNEFKVKPKFSIVIPIYDTERKFLKLLFSSILNQTYDNYEVCIADATDYSTSKNRPRDFLSKINDERIKIKYLKENKNIAANTNEALELATGDYIILCDHDDEMTENALYEIAKVINEDDGSLFIYSDEDKIDVSNSYYFEPHFKSDFNLDLLLSMNYMCHLTAIKNTIVKELIEKDGVFEREDFNGAQDYDLFLRIINIIMKRGQVDKIKHIKKVLYHWRSHDKSTSKDAGTKEYAFVSGSKALMSFYNDNKDKFMPVEKIENGIKPGIYHTIFKKNIIDDKISIIIPNKDHIEDLDVCLNSIEKSTYKNLEVVIVENNSKEKKTFEYYDEVSKKHNFDIRVLYYKGGFNFSKINNFAVKNVDSEYILFLNNDVEMINETSIEEMIYYIKRKDVGAVGGLLLYRDKTIQHAGVVMGFGGMAGHTFIGLHDELTYMNRGQCVQDYNAVTAACLMTKKSVFEEIGGFDEEFGVAFNDIDLCMKIRSKGYLIVYNPYVKFFHYESKTRGLEDTKEKVDRFNIEVAKLLKKWEDKINKGDEYYNPNLTLRKSDFSLRNLNYEKIGEPFKMDDEIYRIKESL